MKKILATALALIALTGCVDGNNYEATAKNIRTETDKFTGVSTLSAPWTGPAGQERLIAQGSKIYAETWVTRDSSMGGWLFADQGYVLGDTKPRQVQRVSSNVDCSSGVCFTHEAFRIPLTRNDIAKGTTAGIEISMRGKGGSTVAKYPAPYVSAFADALK